MTSFFDISCEPDLSSRIAHPFHLTKPAQDLRCQASKCTLSMRYFKNSDAPAQDIRLDEKRSPIFIQSKIPVHNVQLRDAAMHPLRRLYHTWQKRHLTFIKANMRIRMFLILLFEFCKRCSMQRTILIQRDKHTARMRIAQMTSPP